MFASHSSNSVLTPLVSALDKRQLLDRLFQQDPERLLEPTCVPGFEIVECLHNLIDGRHNRIQGQEAKGCLDDWFKPRQGLRARLAIALPAEIGTHYCTPYGNGGFIVLGNTNGLGQQAHEVEPAVGKGASTL